LSAVLQELETGAWLAEALFFPAVSCLGDDPDRLLDRLRRHARRSAEATEAISLHRLHAAGPPRATMGPLALAPPPRPPLWRGPLALSFPVVRWDHGTPPEAAVAFLPSLGIEVVAASAEELDRLIPSHVRAALLRARSAHSLERLVWLQRCRRA